MFLTRYLDLFTSFYSLCASPRLLPPPPPPPPRLLRLGRNVPGVGGPFLDSAAAPPPRAGPPRAGPPLRGAKRLTFPITSCSVPPPNPDKYWTNVSVFVLVCCLEYTLNFSRYVTASVYLAAVPG